MQVQVDLLLTDEMPDWDSMACNVSNGIALLPANLSYSTVYFSVFCQANQMLRVRCEKEKGRSEDRKEGKQKGREKLNNGKGVRSKQ